MRDELTAGLNMLNTTNLDYFGPHHQAEIFRLKGVFLQARGRGRGRGNVDGPGAPEPGSRPGFAAVWARPGFRLQRPSRPAHARTPPTRTQQQLTP
jgi:hypothetical protein